MYVIIDENGMVITPDVDKEMFPFAIEAPEDIIFGDLYVDGEFVRISPRPIIDTPTQKQLREQSYGTMRYKQDGEALIRWDSNDMTVDEANKLWMDYSAEGSTKATELSILISTSKTYIRELYPDM
jgi:hypothetical protein